jgi:hypothetical protein
MKIKLLLSCLVVLAVATAALADPFEFEFRQGPAGMVIPVNDFRAFHSHMTNTGDSADNYTLTVTADDPENWTFGVCFGGICYPPFQTEFRVPAEGDLEPGETMDFDFDVTSLADAGHANYTVQITSNRDAAVTRTLHYEAFTPAEETALLFSSGEGVLGGDVNGFYQFHPVLYNAGTEADSYTLTITRDLPENWSVSYCYGGVCYPPFLDGGQIPDGGGTVASAEAVPIDIDFTTLADEGTGTVVVKVTSNTDPTVYSQATFTLTTGSVVAVDDVPAGQLVSGLHASPNPFNPKTAINFNLGGETAAAVAVDIYDIGGRHLRTLNAGHLNPGPQSLSWDGLTARGDQAPAGVYLARVQTGNEQQILKMSLVK